MDLSLVAILGVVALMAANQLVMRVGALHSRALVFWALQAVNVVVGGVVIVFKLPGFEELPIVSYFVGLLFFFRTVQNTNLRAGWLRDEVKRARKDQDQKAEALRQALERHREESGEATPPAP